MDTMIESKGARSMQIRARMSMSADGYVTTPTGWPSLTADPAFVSSESHGIREFLVGREAALMGLTTFEPALSNDRWPWPNLKVFVLASHRPAGTPDHVATDSDPARLLDHLQSSNLGGDVPPRRWPPHHRDLPRAGSAGQARIGHPAHAVWRWHATDAGRQSRRRLDVRA